MAPPENIQSRKNLKHVLIGCSLIIVLVVLFWPHKIRSPFSASPHKSGSKAPEEQLNIMIKPVIQSIDQRGTPYKISAETAEQTAPLEAVLDQPSGTMTLKDGTELSIQSEAGTFFQDKKKLDLAKDVWLKTDQGYALQALDLHMDFKTNTARTKNPVQGSGPAGDIKAEGMQVHQDGHLTFMGKTQMLIRPNTARKTG